MVESANVEGAQWTSFEVVVPVLHADNHSCEMCRVRGAAVIACALWRGECE